MLRRMVSFMVVLGLLLHAAALVRHNAATAAQVAVAYAKLQQ